MSEHLPRFYYLSNNKFELLPEWSYFFMRLGHQIAGIFNTEYRVVVGIAIPTRVFACSLVATGLVVKKAGSENHIDSSQIQYILGLKPGTPIYVRTDDNRRHPGVVKGFRKYQGKDMIDIRTGKQGQTSYPIDHYASRITISEREEVALPKYKKKGYSTELPSKFLQLCLGNELSQKHVMNSAFQALLIGKKSIIEREVNATSFSCKTSNESTYASGSLQEILRVRQFSGANKSYRTQCISPANITSEKEIGTQTPPIVVYDGAIAYIKLCHKWRSAHQVVLLDRTERQFGDAIELLNQNYAYRLEGGFKFPIRIPDGIEMTVYRDSVR